MDNELRTFLQSVARTDHDRTPTSAPADDDALVALALTLPGPRADQPRSMLLPEAERLHRAESVSGVRARRFTPGTDPGSMMHPDELRREFPSIAPDMASLHRAAAFNYREANNARASAALKRREAA
jgi:hypothetical protein